MTSPLSGHHAGLLTLPNELRSEIYAHVFQGSEMRPRACHTLTHCPYYTKYVSFQWLSFQLIGKSFANDVVAYHELLKNATWFIAGSEDLAIMTRRLSPTQRDLVQNVRICIGATPYETTGSLFLAFEDQYADLSIASLVTTLPNLKLLTFKYDGNGISRLSYNPFYSINDLIDTYKCSAKNLLDQPSFAENILSECCVADAYRRDLSVRPVDILADFAKTATICIKRTAAASTMRKWYYKLFRDASTEGIEIQLRLEFLFMTPAYLDGDRDAQMFDTFKDVLCSTKDWTIRLSFEGTEYTLPQLPLDTNSEEMDTD